MDNLRSSLKNMLVSYNFITTVMPFGFVLILLYPALSFISSLNYLKFFALTRSLFYIIYLVGILLCFAAELDWAIGAAFAIFGVQYLVIMIRNFSFNALVYAAFYSLLAVVFFRSLMLGKKFNSGSVPHRNIPNINKGYVPHSNPAFTQSANSEFCASCGKPVDPTGSFCPYCGAQYQSSPSQQYISNTFSRPVNTVQYSGPAANLASMCGSTLALVFTVLLTANVVFSLVANFSVATLIVQIPLILFCVGCWMIYSGCAKGNLNESGFSLVGGVMIAELILCYIPPVIGTIAGVILMLQGDELTAIGIGIVIACSMAMWFYTMYWNGLRKTVTSAKMMLRGVTYTWQTSMFSIVLICIGAVSQLISLASRSSAQAYLNQVISSLTYELYYATGSNELSNMVTNYITSLLGGGNGLATFNSLLSISVMICAAVILIQIRNQNKVAR